MCTCAIGLNISTSSNFWLKNNHVKISSSNNYEGRKLKKYECVFFGNFRDCNNNIMELLIMAYACKTSSAKSIVAVIPYLPYSKQCKMRKRGCIVSKLLAKMMCKSGLTHVITMDLHQKEIQGFFDCPVDNLRASPFLLQYIQECVCFYEIQVHKF